MDSTLIYLFCLTLAFMTLPYFLEKKFSPKEMEVYYITVSFIHGCIYSRISTQKQVLIAAIGTAVISFIYYILLLVTKRAIKKEEEKQ